MVEELALELLVLLLCIRGSLVYLWMLLRNLTVAIWALTISNMWNPNLSTSHRKIKRKWIQFLMKWCFPIRPWTNAQRLIGYLNLRWHLKHSAKSNRSSHLQVLGRRWTWMRINWKWRNLRIKIRCHLHLSHPNLASYENDQELKDSWILSKTLIHHAMIDKIG